MKIFYSIILALAFSTIAHAQTIDHKVDSLLNLMTLDEKIGRMTQAERGALETISDIEYYKIGSLLSGGGSSPTPNTVESWANMYDEYQSYALQTRLGIPLIYGIDAVHGHNNVYGAVIFPHNIGMGCTWNPDLVKTANQITASEVAATGIDWTFSPCITVPQNERWGRTYEGFGETPEIQEIMAAASVEGLQGDDLSKPETILSCAKHWVGDGGTTNGTDQGNTQVSEEELRATHMPGYIDAINANVGTIMASYNSWNGQKLHGHNYLLTTVLKEELGFKGFVISDWAGVDQVAEDYREAVKRSVNAGVDMVMVPDRYIYFISILKDLVEKNEVSMDRIDDAVRRILKQKFLLNLFNEPYTDPSFASSVGSAAHRDVARQAARESLVLLSAKNDVLPLQKDNQKILVAGRLANDLGAQCGGWTISWQGSNGDITDGTTILEGIQELAGNSQIIYSQNGETNQSVDAAVVVFGEDPYAEGAGDRTNLNISSEDVNLIKKLKEKGIPVISVLISGRPMIIGELLPYTDAFIAAWLPGSEGDGIVEVLFGDFTPSGKLTHSWPTNIGQIPINVGDDDYNPLFPYKQGLQEFPESTSNSKMEAYAAVTSRSGDKLILTLTDQVTSISSDANDFQIKLNGQEVTNLIEEIQISGVDESMLEIYLNSPIESEDIVVTLSYSGDGILSSSMSLEKFTDLFVYNAVKYDGLPHPVPGKVQAEEFSDMYGIDTEPCEDIGGGFNVGWIENGDWLKYTIDVKTTGTYELLSRISGYEPGTINFKFDEKVNAYVNFISTEGWQSWDDFKTNVFLEEGIYEMEVNFYSSGFNINYFNFKLLTGVDEKKPALSSIAISPNPVSNNFNLSFSSLSNSDLEINLFDMTGKRAQSLYQGKATIGLNSFSFDLNTDLPEGMYFIEIKDGIKRYFRKLLKK